MEGGNERRLDGRRVRKEAGWKMCMKGGWMYGVYERRLDGRCV
jgi:hypothetical protein